MASAPDTDIPASAMRRGRTVAVHNYAVVPWPLLAMAGAGVWSDPTARTEDTDRPAGQLHDPLGWPEQ
jgi:hypothetical protein